MPHLFHNQLTQPLDILELSAENSPFNALPSVLPPSAATTQEKPQKMGIDTQVSDN